ncbi:MAG: HAD-IA family hydrolase [Micrococcales bacterium]|nr:HAD-IA family hydrolase [Micrococcales bacterium]
MTHPRWPRVLFDLDGTVVDTVPLIIESYAHAINEVLGLALDEARARRWIGRALIDTFQEEYPGHAEELFEAYVEFNKTAAPSLLRRVDGMESAIDSLARAGVRVGIATSKRRSSAMQTLELAGLGTAFDVVVTAEDTDAHKPEPDPLWLAAGRLGGDGPVAYVGDAVVDIQAAKAAGFVPVAVTWGAGDVNELRAAHPDEIVRTTAELVHLVLGG